MTARGRALVLDFGGVVSKTLFETHELSEQALGLPTGSLDWRGPFAPTDDLLWQRMQADEITEREYWQQRTREVADLAGASWSEMSQFVGAVRGDDVDAIIRPEVNALVTRAREEGAKLAILSNELDLFYGAGFTERCAFLENFNVIQDATYTKILKPDPRAYIACAAALNVEIGDCVFVDDQIRNIRGAERTGMPAIHLDVTCPAPGFERALTLLMKD